MHPIYDHVGAYHPQFLSAVILSFLFGFDWLRMSDRPCPLHDRPCQKTGATVPKTLAYATYSVPWTHLAWLTVQLTVCPPM